MKQSYVVTLIGGIGNILQTAPLMAWLKGKGHKVVGRVHKDAYSREICEMISPSYHHLIEHGETIPDSIDKGGMKVSKLNKAEWQAWFEFHGFFVPRDVSRLDIEFKQMKSPSRVVIAPCCKPNWPMKRWPHWNDLVSKIPNCTVVGMPTDGESLTGDFTDLRGKTSLRELAGILADADYVIAEEGGVAHLACAVGTKTYILYGGTNPVKNKPPFNSVQIMSSEQFDCQPCQGRSMHREGDWTKGSEMFYGCKKQDMVNGHTRCMNSLQPFEVMKAIADNGDWI